MDLIKLVIRPRGLRLSPSGRLPVYIISELKEKPYSIKWNRVRRIFWVTEKNVIYNIMPDIYIIEYETNHPEYYCDFHEYAEKLLSNPSIEVREVNCLNMGFDWDADEPRIVMELCLGETKPRTIYNANSIANEW